MAANRVPRQPEILILWFEPSIGRMVSEILMLEGIEFTSTRTARETLDIVKHGNRPYIVLMDNFAVNPEAKRLLMVLRARPKLHKRVRVIGMAVWRWEELGPLDAFIEMPFTPPELINPIERLCAELQFKP